MDLDVGISLGNQKKIKCSFCGRKHEDVFVFKHGETKHISYFCTTCIADLCTFFESGLFDSFIADVDKTFSGQ